jgi:hypothetical protein
MSAFLFYPNNFLFSEVNITDGQWHHVGFVWDVDTWTRVLYVDDVEVAKDIPGDPWYGGHFIRNVEIGADSYFPSGSEYFWSGLIDDIRIYNRAIESFEKKQFRRP